jgi:hypothetical protein
MAVAMRYPPRYWRGASDNPSEAYEEIPRRESDMDWGDRKSKPKNFIHFDIDLTNSKLKFHRSQATTLITSANLVLIGNYLSRDDVAGCGLRSHVSAPVIKARNIAAFLLQACG